jgi:hypothetical protein
MPIDHALAISLMTKFNLAPDPWQVEVIEKEHPRLLLNCCRQAGKSTVVAFLALFTALTKYMTRVLILSRSHRQSRELFRRVTEFYEIVGEHNKQRRTVNELEMTNESRIICLPCNEATVRGYAHIDMVIIDEAARVPDELYRAVRPMIAVSGGKIICLSTPYGKRGFFWQAWAHGGSDWARIEVPATKVPRIPPEFLEEERRAMGEAWFRQEYCCSFEAMEGLVYPDFDRCVIETLPAHVVDVRGPGFPRQDRNPTPQGESVGRNVGGMDFGFRNPFAAVWGNLDRDFVLYLTGEHYQKERPLSYHIQHIPRDVIYYADPAGASDIAELKMGGYKVTPGINSIRTGIGAVTARLEDGSLKVLEGRCPNLLKEAERYRWAEDGNSEAPVDASNHALGALRYMISRLDERRLGRSRPVPKDAATLAAEKEAEENRRWWQRAHEDPGPGSIWTALG